MVDVSKHSADPAPSSANTPIRAHTELIGPDSALHTSKRIGAAVDDLMSTRVLDAFRTFNDDIPSGRSRK